MKGVTWSRVEQEECNLEISRMNGIPLYFRLLATSHTTSLLTLLCGYYRYSQARHFLLQVRIQLYKLESYCIFHLQYVHRIKVYSILPVCY
jgi:hypothetical protein